MAVSKNQVNKAADIYLDPSADQDSKGKALEIVENWRGLHSQPMERCYEILLEVARALDGNAVVTRRFKRLESIALKLRRIPNLRLTNMQDLGGCRAVVRDVSTVYALRDRLRGALRLREREDDYIQRPSDDGYRSLHLVYEEDRTGLGLRTEIQLRTRIQHTWATAVETVGRARSENLKHGEGSSEWLRFFYLMGSAISTREDTPPRRLLVENLDELRRLALALDVEGVLRREQTNVQVIYTVAGNWQWQVLDLNKAAFTTTTSVTGFNLIEDASQYFLNLEREGRDVVMLSTTPTDALQGLAYPNFFAVTDPFIELMNDILRD